MIEKIIEKYSIDFLKNNSIKENLNNATKYIQKVQDTLYAYVNDDTPETMKKVRIGTVLTFSLVTKIAEGKKIKDFTEADWIEIATKVSEDGIIADWKQYSILVFKTYTDYIDISVMKLKEKGVPETKCNAINDISNEVKELSSELLSGNITESEYTEQCLWLLVESMLKLLSAYTTLIVGEDMGFLLESISMLGFEYARYTIYAKEYELIDRYIQNQYKLDAEIEAKLANLNELLQQKLSEFDDIISNAYSKDVMTRFKSSVDIAVFVGVDKDEIIDSIEKVDDFFEG